LKQNPKIKVYFFALTILVLLAFQLIKKNTTIAKTKTLDKIEIKSNKANEVPPNAQLLSKSNLAKAYCIQHKFDTNFCCLLDLSQHSGNNRFVIWDFKTSSIIKQFPVSHGCGDSLWGADFSKTNPQFSNEFESHCSSIGKYKIGKRGYSNWGINIKYLLHGLESTNSNAMARTIVLHSWEAVSDSSTYPFGTPEGWGCPAISNNQMLFLDSMLKNAKQPVLMWLY
jgi:hypothetical protein